MTVGVRRMVVAHLTERGMGPAKIADELGVSKETVRRDLHKQPPPASLTAGTVVADDVLALRLDEPLRAALVVLRSTMQTPDTAEHNRAAARAAIRATADTVLEAHRGVKP
ncbi:helix-turn-helix domain-containing protein [Streptomyces sp. NPDC000878]